MIDKFEGFLKEQQKIAIRNFPVELIIEGLIKSIDFEDVVSRLSSFLKDESNIRIQDKSIYVNIHRNFFNKGTCQKLFNLLNVLGYTISNFWYDDNAVINKVPDETDIFKNNYDILTIRLIKKFDTSHNGIPLILFHVTNTKNIQKIKSKGLIPKSGNKIENHPERIYLTDSIEGANDFINSLNQMYPNSTFTVLKIQTKLLNKLTLYYDPSFFTDENIDSYNYNVFYSYDNISPYAIEFEKEV